MALKALEHRRHRFGRLFPRCGTKIGEVFSQVLRHPHGSIRQGRKRLASDVDWISDDLVGAVGDVEALALWRIDRAHDDEVVGRIVDAVGGAAAAVAGGHSS